MKKPPLNYLFVLNNCQNLEVKGYFIFKVSFQRLHIYWKVYRGKYNESKKLIDALSIFVSKK